MMIFSILILMCVSSLRIVSGSCGSDDGYAMYVWTQGFNASAPFCGGIYPESKAPGTDYATCWYHNWESSSARQHLWASMNVPNRKITRIFVSDVKKRIEYNGYKSPNSNICDQDLISFLTESHQRGIKVYALFAVSDASFSETYMAKYPHQFNLACGTEFAYFDGVSVNNEHFSKVRDCSLENQDAQLQFLTDLQTTATNSKPLPLHFSVSWNWDCCNCSSDSYVPRTLDWDGQSKTALEHMIDIVDSVDVQVAYNVPTVMERRARPPHQYWTNKNDKSSTSALYILAYASPNYLCQLSFSPHKTGSTTVQDECKQGDRTEAGMFAAFDFIENALDGAIGGIHYMGGVYSTGMTDDWPKHDLKDYTCSLDKRYNRKKDKCVNRCKKGKIWNWSPNPKTGVCRCYCPKECKRKRKGKCKPRCKVGTEKWDTVGKTCLSIIGSEDTAGYIWDRSSRSCILI
jgi:hypothetical protein